MTSENFSDLSMLDLFHMEVEEQATLFNENLLIVESHLDDPLDALQPFLEVLMRSAHSIKGAAKIVGLEEVVKVAHRMEDCFVAMQRGEIQLGDRQIDILFGVVDWFTTVQQVPADDLPQWLPSETATVNHLVTELNALLGIDEPLEEDAPPPATEDLEGEEEIIAAIAEPPTVREALPPLSTPNIAAIAEPIIESAVPPSPAPQSPKPQEAETDPSEESDNLQTNRAIRVSTENLNQIMALAGESVVESHWLQRFGDSTIHMRRQQQELIRHLDQLQQLLPTHVKAQEVLDQARKVTLDSYTLLSDRLTELEQFSRRFDQLSDNLYREVIASHMRPFIDGIQTFPRMTRDLSKGLGKKAQLVIKGLAIKVDRDILEKLETPLVHMIRNAIAHGIETPAERLTAGKPEVGKLVLEAKHQAGMLTITLEDDGRGIDLNELRRKVVEKQLTAPDMVAQLSELELLEFLFLPGFSTAKQVDEISGRGVGLDIAKTMVQDVGGLLRVQTKLGEGTSFHFQLPLTLSVIRALLVDIGGEPYAFNLNRIDRVMMVHPYLVEMTENSPYIEVDGENVSLVKAHQILQLPSSPKDFELEVPVILLSDHTHRYAVVVDRFLGERDLVVRPLDPRLGKVQDISAAAIAENGQPILIIDVADLVRTIDQLVSGGDFDSLQDQVVSPVRTKIKQILVVDDSITVREMERKLLQNQGYQVDVAVNGMEGWNAIRAGQYDLIISDVDMPRMNGIELVQHIKNHPQFQAIPVIIVSYKDREEDQLAGLEAGADYYLTKSSFHDNSLINAVNDLIGAS